MILLLGVAFVAGLVTILAPCIWPILPIVLSSSAAGKGHQRPLGITLGIMLSFGFFTLASSYLVRLFNFNPNSLRLAAVVIIGFLGLIMVVPWLSERLEGLVSRVASSSSQGQGEHNGFSGGFVVGLSLGVVWSPCAGPILASIAALAATGKVTFAVVLVTAAYVTGLGVPLFIIAYGGRKVVLRTRFLSAHAGRIQQSFGLIMIVTALAIYTGYDRVLERKLLNAFPAFSSSLGVFETSNAVTQQLDVLKGKASPAGIPVAAHATLLNANTPAPEIIGISKWLNTDSPITIGSDRGKVILIDFWTYTCINCIRTLPHVTSWYERYKDQGFVVIGVHTPEFQFEHDSNNVIRALAMYGIRYPVALDNDFATWNNFSNQYWPAEYLIDASGNIRRTHFGEGEYDVMEASIRELLQQNGKKLSASMPDVGDQTPSGRQSPETYLGAARMQYFYKGGSISTGKRSFEFSGKLGLNAFSLQGDWNIMNEGAVAGVNAQLQHHFYADKVFLVLRPAVSGVPSRVHVRLDGKPLDASNAGADVDRGEVRVNADRLYNLIDLRGRSGDHTLHLRFETPGIEAFAFTFG